MSRFFARLALSIAALIVMLVAAVIAVGYFALALFLFASSHMSPPLAAVATGFLILLLAAFLALAVRAGSGHRRSLSEGQSNRAARETAAQLGGELGRRLLGLADSNRTGSLVAALVAGFAVGVSPKLREFLLDVLKR